MNMFHVTAFSPDSSEEIYTQIIAGEDEDDAIDNLQELLDQKNMEYGMCMAEPIDEM